MAILSRFPNRDELSQRVADDRPFVVGDLILVSLSQIAAVFA